jgi:hypothetical protein
LKGLGWKIMTDPKSCDDIYIPPNGTIDKGSRLGIDFYDNESLWFQRESLDFVETVISVTLLNNPNQTQGIIQKREYLLL